MADVLRIPKTASRGSGVAMEGFLDGMLYWSAIFIPFGISIFLFLYLFYQPAAVPEDFLHELLYWAKFFWFAGVLATVSNIAGLLYFGSPRKRTQNALRAYRAWDPDYLLILSYVSRGENREALARAMRASIEALERAGANYHIEVVTDTPVISHLSSLLSKSRIAFYVVPRSYQTPRNTKFKARALHYLTEHRSYEHGKSHGWILHLDEESSVTHAAIVGIHRFITDPKNARTIGQGEIKYNAYGYGKNIFITAMDSIRTGDDLGRFRLQFGLCKAPLFGMHGSFILLADEVERENGFDLGWKGSITEDAYFALLCKQQGIRFGWVDGFIREQSPFTISDILRQRRRWFCGLIYLSFDPVVKLRYRAALMAFTLLWSVAWIGPVVTLLNIALGGGYFPFMLVYSAALIQGGNGAIYLLGAYHNTEDSGLPFLRKLYIAAAALVLLPVSSLLEGGGVLWAIFSPVKTFEVVRK